MRYAPEYTVYRENRSLEENVFINYFHYYVKFRISSYFEDGMKLLPHAQLQKFKYRPFDSQPFFGFPYTNF